MGILDRWQKKEEALSREKAQPAKKTVKDEAVKEEVKKSSGGKTHTGSVLSNKIILKPMITEKTALLEAQNKYGFFVDLRANKTQIKRAIKEIYGIEPSSVNVINTEGKRVRFGRATGRRSDYKKAFVTLPKGKTITVHEGV